MRFLAIFCAASLACIAAPLVAQPSEEGSGPTRPDNADELLASPEVVRAEELGELLYLYDQAAWYGTDKAVEELDAEKEGHWLRGFLVEPDEEGQLWFVVYGEIDGILTEALRYRVENREIMEGGIHPEGARPLLSENAQKMAHALGVARQFANDEEMFQCVDAAFNNVVLPPDENGTVPVYLFTPPTEDESYPLGGHYRIDVGADGEVVSSREFLKTCMRASWAQSEGITPSAMFVSHLLDDQPTEIHTFVSRYIPIALYVMTVENELMWVTGNGRVHEVVQIDPPTEE